VALVRGDGFQPASTACPTELRGLRPDADARPNGTLPFCWLAPASACGQRALEVCASFAKSPPVHNMHKRGARPCDDTADTYLGDTALPGRARVCALLGAPPQATLGPRPPLLLPPPSLLTSLLLIPVQACAADALHMWRQLAARVLVLQPELEALVEKAWLAQLAPWMREGPFGALHVRRTDKADHIRTLPPEAFLARPVTGRSTCRGSVTGGPAWRGGVDGGVRVR